MGQQEGPFIDGIISFHIQRRVAFCKTQLLRQQQGLLEIQLVFEHFGEDEIGGAVHDGL